MTDNITLPRVVGKTIRKALTRRDRYLFPTEQAALDALTAALAEPPAICSAQDNEAALERVANKVKPGQVKGLLPEAPAKSEPVHPGYIIGSHWLETAYSRIAAGESEAKVLTEVLGARGWVKPEPATVEQIDEEYIGPVIDARWHDFEAGFRAAERFHNIRGSKT
jgi:hypothetical protein